MNYLFSHRDFPSSSPTQIVSSWSALGSLQIHPPWGKYHLYSLNESVLWPTISISLYQIAVLSFSYSLYRSRSPCSTLDRKNNKINNVLHLWFRFIAPSAEHIILHHNIPRFIITFISVSLSTMHFRLVRLMKFEYEQTPSRNGNRFTAHLPLILWLETFMLR